jgi:hypothetical protein
VWSVEPDHELYHRYAAQGAKAKALAAVNSADNADDACQKFDKLIEAADEGKWSLLGEGGPKYTPLVRAVAEFHGIEEAKADTIVKGLTKGQQAKLRNTARISALLAKYKADQESDGDAVLDGLLPKEEADDASERAA